MSDRYAIVDGEGNVEFEVRGSLDQAVDIGTAEGFEVCPDATALYDAPLGELIQNACASLPNQDRVSGDYAWERTGYLQIHMEEVMRYSLRDAWQVLVPYFPRLLKPTRYRDAGEVSRAWATREAMIENLLASNYKTGKEFPWAPVDVVGLSLLPATMWSQSAGANAEVEYRNRPGALPIVSRGSTFNFCVGASRECIEGCLVYSGYNMIDPYNLLLKKAKMSALMLEPAAFGRILLEACKRHRGTGKRKMTPMVRLNIYSDIPWEQVFPGLFEELSDMMFYDYTKVPDRKAPRNYHLTFSYSGRNEPRMVRELARGQGAAVVFLDTQKYADSSAPRFSPAAAGLPDNFLGYEVVDGDISDVRPFDVELAQGPPPYIVGLRWKIPKKGSPVTPDTRFAVPVHEYEGRLVASITPRQEPDTDPDSDVAEEGVVEATPAELQAAGLVRNHSGAVKAPPVDKALKSRLMR